MRLLALSIAFSGLLSACAASPQSGAESPASGGPSPGQPDGAAPASNQAGATPDQGQGSSDPQASGMANARELMPDTEPDPSRSLPEVSVRTVGLHIGGGPNDEPSRTPFREAVERRFDAFLECYKRVEDPERGGTFGVDLFIPREGGHPEVRQARTIMGGGEFRECVKAAYGDVEFSRPPKGPTVISYSVRFEVRDPTRSE